MLKKTFWATNGLIFLSPPVSQVRQSWKCISCHSCSHTISTDLWTEPEQVDCPFKRPSTHKDEPKLIIRELPTASQKYQDDDDFKPKPKKDWRRKK